MAVGYEAWTNTWAVAGPSLRMEALRGFATLEYGGWKVARRSDGRFDSDRCMESAGPGAVLLDGVLLNRAELITKTASPNTAELLMRLRSRLGTAGALNSLRGVFSGCFIDLATGQLEVFANQTGDTAVYIYCARGGVVASNSFDVLIALLRENELSYTFDDRAARMILSHGFMVDGTTFAQEVRRLAPGSFATVTSAVEIDPTFRETRYWTLSNEPSMSSAIEKSVDEFDDRFRNAVRRGFDKDLEHGFPGHLADMSGGLDARMVNATAADLGYRSILNITYGQFRSSDVRYARRASQALGNTTFIMPLDDGDCLLSPTEILRLNSGAAYYGGITGGKTMLEMINFERVGLEHNGMLGDVVAGSFVREQDAQPDGRAGRYSVLHDFGDLGDASAYPNQELYLMGTRGFLGAVSSHLTRSHYTYPYSPFLDVDVLEFAMSIPVSIRRDHVFYREWVARKYPHTLSTPTTRRLGRPRPFGTELPTNLRKVADRVSARAHSKFGVRLVEPTSTMNPFEYWYQENARLRALLDAQVDRARDAKFAADLRVEVLRSVAREATVADKLLGTTVLEMHDLYFS